MLILQFIKHENNFKYEFVSKINLYPSIKVFHLYSKKPMENNYLDELVTNVVDLYDNILKINERFPSVF